MCQDTACRAMYQKQQLGRKGQDPLAGPSLALALTLA